MRAHWRKEEWVLRVLYFWAGTCYTLSLACVTIRTNFLKCFAVRSLWNALQPQISVINVVSNLIWVRSRIRRQVRLTWNFAECLDSEKKVWAIPSCTSIGHTQKPIGSARISIITWVIILKRHSTSRSTNQIAGNSFLRSEIILKLDINTVHVIISILKSPSSAAGIVDSITTRLSSEDE